MLDITGCLIVIVGGGAVAARKAAGLVEAGAARIHVIASEFRAEFDPVVHQIHRPYAPTDLKDARLVFAATDSATINDSVVRDANALGIWANRADSSDQVPGHFVTPAKFQSGQVMVTVSAGSAALAAVVRDGLAQRFDPAWSEMADAMKILRPIIKAQDPSGHHRAELFRALASPEAMAVLSTSGIEGLKNWLSRR